MLPFFSFCPGVILRLIYRVVQKAEPQFYFCDNFRKRTPILTFFLLLQQEMYDA